MSEPAHLDYSQRLPSSPQALCPRLLDTATVSIPHDIIIAGLTAVSLTSPLAFPHHFVLLQLTLSPVCSKPNVHLFRFSSILTTEYSVICKQTVLMLHLVGHIPKRYEVLCLCVIFQGSFFFYVLAVSHMVFALNMPRFCEIEIFIHFLFAIQPLLVANGNSFYFSYLISSQIYSHSQLPFLGQKCFLMYSITVVTIALAS